jgi:carboxypeptidase A
MYSLLNLIHGGAVHKKPEMKSILKEGRYLFIPTVNVDGAVYIEEQYEKTGKLELKRKNMHFYPGQVEKCGKTTAGVDLNRNYDIDYDDRDSAALSGENMCNDQFNGPKAFSEPETRAMRDFLTKEKDSLNFVYNLHSFGNFFIFPYNFEEPNSAFQEIP